MKKRPEILELLFVVMTFLVLLSSIAVTNHTYAQNATSEDEDVEFAVNVKIIKVHLVTAFANKQMENLALAKAHLSHHGHELFSVIGDHIKKHDTKLADELENALDQLSHNVDIMSASEFKQEVSRINALLDDSLKAVLSETTIDDAKFQMSVMIKLLREAEHQYEEAYEDGSIKNVMNYEDAQELRVHANRIFESIADNVDDTNRERLRELFLDLRTSMNTTAEPEKVRSLIDEIVHVVPEFPIGVVVLAVLLSAMVLATRLRGSAWIKR